MAVILVLFAILLFGALLIFMKWAQVKEQQDIWLEWGIDSYIITLRHSGGMMDSLDSEELGAGTTLTVSDGQISHVTGNYGDVSLQEWEQYTVEGLFKKAFFHLAVQYDTVYGFPLRLGSQLSWSVEVVDFRPMHQS